MVCVCASSSRTYLQAAAPRDDARDAGILVGARRLRQGGQVLNLEDDGSHQSTTCSSPARVTAHARRVAIADAGTWGAVGTWPVIAVPSASSTTDDSLTEPTVHDSHRSVCHTYAYSVSPWGFFSSVFFSWFPLLARGRCLCINFRHRASTPLSAKYTIPRC